MLYKMIGALGPVLATPCMIMRKSLCFCLVYVVYMHGTMGGLPLPLP